MYFHLDRTHSGYFEALHVKYLILSGGGGGAIYYVL